MDVVRDLAQAARAMIAGIHRCHVRQQRLRGADVAGGFLTTNVLLAGLEGEAQGRASARILGNTHDSAWHAAFEGVAGCEEGRMRAAAATRRRGLPSLQSVLQPAGRLAAAATGQLADQTFAPVAGRVPAADIDTPTTEDAP